MKYLFFSYLFLTATFTLGQADLSPAELVDAQLEAYNSKNLEAFLNTYSEHIQVFEFGMDLPFIDGKEHLRRNYRAMFEGSEFLDAQVQKRIQHGNKVIDRETAKGIYNGDTVEVVVIYEINNGLIDRVTFIY